MNKPDAYGRQFWIVTVYDGYGSFAYYGTEKEAEQRRKEKAIWKSAVAKKRLATDSDEDKKLIERYGL